MGYERMPCMVLQSAVDAAEQVPSALLQQHRGAELQESLAQ